MARIPTEYRQYFTELLGKEKAKLLMRSIQSQQIIVVKGPQASGKTTLVKAIRDLGGCAYDDYNTVIIETNETLKELCRDFSPVP